MVGRGGVTLSLSFKDTVFFPLVVPTISKTREKEKERKRRIARPEE
jgi:hypothetical protein